MCSWSTQHILECKGILDIQTFDWSSVFAGNEMMLCIAIGITFKVAIAFEGNIHSNKRLFIFGSGLGKASSYESFLLDLRWVRYNEPQWLKLNILPTLSSHVTASFENLVARIISSPCSQQRKWIFEVVDILFQRLQETLVELGIKMAELKPRNFGCSYLRSFWFNHQSGC